MVSVVILARLLSPSDFGLIAMVTAFTSIITVMKSLGLSTATLQREKITHGEVSTLFWVNVLAGLVLTALVASLAPVLSWFYDEPRLESVAIALAFTFLISCVGIQHTAILRRQMRFGATALVEVASALIGLTCAIVWAIRGDGYWALVIARLGSSMTEAVLPWILCAWRPGLPTFTKAVRALVNFGAKLTGAKAVDFSARNIDKILLGHVWGSHSLGIYSKAQSMLLIPLQQVAAPVAAVAVSAMSRLQDDPVRFCRYYLKSVQTVAYVTMPAVAALGILAPHLVSLLLGEKWFQVTTVFQLLSVAALVLPIERANALVYVSLGRTGRMAQWAMVAASIRSLSFVVGLPWGVNGVACAYSATTIGLLLPGMLFCFRDSPLRVSHLLPILVRPFAVAVVVAVSMSTALQVADPAEHLWALAVSLLSAVAALCAVVSVNKSVRRDMLFLLENARRTLVRS